MATDEHRAGRQQMQALEGLAMKFTSSGSVWFDHMGQKGLSSIARDALETRIARTGLEEVFSGLTPRGCR